MQLKQLLTTGCLVLISFASCNKKDNTIIPEVTLAGDWAGKYSILSEPYNSYYGFRIQPDGVLELRDSAQQKTGAGNWELDGVIFTGNYTLLPPATGVFSVIATFNKNTGYLNGTWGINSQEYGGGYWYMYKTN